MGTAKSNYTFSMRVTVVSIFFFLSLLTVSIALGLQYYFSYSLAEDAAHKLFGQVAENVRDHIHGLDEESNVLTNLLAEYPEMGEPVPVDGLHPSTQLMARAIQLHDYLYAIYIGYENGDFYELINLNSDPALRTRMQAKPQDRWLVIKILNTANGRERRFEYYSDSFQLTGKRAEPSNYRASDRPWYRNALRGDGVEKTAPYLFHNLQSPGVTYAKAIPQTGNVIAVDISLSTLSDFLSEERMIEGSEMLIFANDGKLAAHSFAMDEQSEQLDTARLVLSAEEQAYIESLGTLRVSNELNWPPFDFSYSGKPLGYSIDVMQLLAAKTGLMIEFSNGYNWNEITELFQQGKLDIVHSIFNTDFRQSWGLFTEPYLSLPSALVTRSGAEPISGIEQLYGKVVAIPSGWSLEGVIQRNHPQIRLLPVTDSLEALHAVIDGRAFAAMETQQVIQYLMKVNFLDELQISPRLPELTEASPALSIIVAADKAPLRAILNRAIAAITAQEREALAQKWLTYSTEKHILRSIEAGVVPSKRLIEMANISGTEGPQQQPFSLHQNRYIGYVDRIESLFSTDENIAIVVPEHAVSAAYIEKVHISVLFTLATMLLLAPLILFFAHLIVKPVNALAKENAKIKRREFKAVETVPSHILELAELSNSMTAMAASIEAHQLSQQELMDSFIRLIAQAIDEKSPYTGGHCERVPELAIMLAEAASHSNSEAFRQFALETEEQWREFKIAAWLHDCGKVTTPEHIVDKGSKLETNYNRIHEIRTRFEVLWRDAEISYWKGVAAGDDKAKLQRQLQCRQQQIRDDFAFVAQSNIGSEAVRQESIQRIKQIGAQTWSRNLDNRLGLSPAESRRLQPDQQSLPATEPLLNDHPEHLIDWPNRTAAKQGAEIKMQAPEYQANLGEIYNLSIERGTLTAEDRYRINEHVISTIRMLEELPLPDELSRVPEYAGGHHETLIGTGYPKQVSAEQLSIPARILAVADVFEALTAADRPYKNAKSLSESIRILYAMAERQHLDMDIVKLLLASGIYQQYAKRYLNREQIDDIDLESYLNPQSKCHA